MSNKIVNTPVLLDMFDRARKFGFNRQGPLREITLDSNGLHVLTLVLYGHNMDSAQIFHHRVRVLAKEEGFSAPVEFLLDVEDTYWDRIPDAETVMAAMTAQNS